MRKFFSCLALVSISFFVFISPIKAANSRDVTATIKLAVCGDSVVESPEDCDGTELSGSSCTSLGYDSGTLSCDVSCSFDTSSCTTASTTIATPAPSPPRCTDQPPGAKTPWLYGAIAQDANSILLYFTEADNPVNKYVLEFGTKSGSYTYGVQDMGVNSRGQMTFLVKSLSANTTYYFRVRGGNGCATGGWSNEISSKTKSNIVLNQLNITSQLETTPFVETPSTQTSESNQQPTNETQVVTAPKTITAVGYNVNIRVVDSDGNPVEGATVTIYSVPQTAITDKTGTVTFKNMEAGEHRVEVTYGDFKGEQSINLTKDVTGFDLTVTIKPKLVMLSTSTLIAIAAVALVIAILVILIKSRRKIKNLLNSTPLQTVQSG